MFLWFLRGVEYVRLIPSFRLPILAIGKALHNLFSFMIFFAFILYGGSLTFRFLYGTSSKDFSTMLRTVTSLSMASLGEINVSSIMADYRFVNAQFFAIIWAFVATFVLLTMFVAIVDEGFQSAKSELNPDPKTGGTVTVKTILVDGSVVEYEGKGKRVNIDETFDVKFVNPKDGKTYVDLGIRRKQIHHEVNSDINDSIFIAVLRHHLEPTFKKMYDCFSKKQSYMHHKVNVMVKERSITRSNTVVVKKKVTNQEKELKVDDKEDSKNGQTVVPVVEEEDSLTFV